MLGKKWVSGIRYCLTCQEETMHELLYLGDYLKAGKCCNCHSTFENRRLLLRIYMLDLLDRIVSKPYRIYTEVRGKRSLFKPSTWLGYGREVLRIPLDEASNLKEILAEEFKHVSKGD